MVPEVEDRVKLRIEPKPTDEVMDGLQQVDVFSEAIIVQAVII